MDPDISTIILHSHRYSVGAVQALVHIDRGVEEALFAFSVP